MPRVAKVSLEDIERTRAAQVGPGKSQFDKLVEHCELLDAVSNLNLHFLQMISLAARDCPNILLSVLDHSVRAADLEVLADLDLATCSGMSQIRVPLFVIPPAVIFDTYQKFKAVEQIDDLHYLVRTPLDPSLAAAQLNARLVHCLSSYLAAFQRAVQIIPNLARAILPCVVSDQEIDAWARLTPDIRTAIACTATPLMSLTVGQIRQHLVTDDPLRMLANSLISFRQQGARS